MNRFHRYHPFYALLALTGFAIAASAGLPLETETARPVGTGQFEVSGAMEFQTSKEGTERATPLAFEYGLTDRWEFLVEPVFYTAIRPKKGPHATGLGDVETTLTFLASREKATLPALALAVEIKIPTAKNVQIGTGKADYTAYLIASKSLTNFDAHANLAYTVVGQPPRQTLNNLISYAVAVEYHLSPRWDLVTEAYGNTSALAEAKDAVTGTGESAVIPEASGGEVVGMVGGRYHILPHLGLSLGVSYDNSHAVLIAPGLSYSFK
jgi:hypothetical protein